jgi:hypothetical protein
MQSLTSHRVPSRSCLDGCFTLMVCEADGICVRVDPILMDSSDEEDEQPIIKPKKIRKRQRQVPELTDEEDTPRARNAKRPGQSTTSPERKRVDKISTAGVSATRPKSKTPATPSASVPPSRSIDSWTSRRSVSPPLLNSLFQPQGIPLIFHIPASHEDRALPYLIVCHFPVSVPCELANHNPTRSDL